MVRRLVAGTRTSRASRASAQPDRLCRSACRCSFRQAGVVRRALLLQAPPRTHPIHPITRGNQVSELKAREHQAHRNVDEGQRAAEVAAREQLTDGGRVPTS